MGALGPRLLDLFPGFSQLRASSGSFLGPWAFSQPFLGLGLFWAFFQFFLGLGPFLGVLNFFPAFSGPRSGPLPSLFLGYSRPFLGLEAFFGLFLGFWTYSQPFLDLGGAFAGPFLDSGLFLDVLGFWTSFPHFLGLRAFCGLFLGLYWTFPLFLVSGPLLILFRASGFFGPFVGFWASSQLFLGLGSSVLFLGFWTFPSFFGLRGLFASRTLVLLWASEPRGLF